MSKILKLKEWVTLPEAARHLSSVFDEEVTEAAILRLALDGRLRLSVHFVNNATARETSIVGIDGVDYSEVPLDATGEININLGAIEPGAKYVRLITSVDLGDGRFLKFTDKIKDITGVWDLPLAGGERLHVEHEYQRLTGGPAVTLSCLDGTFINQEDGDWCQLQEDFEDNEYAAGSLAHLYQLDLEIQSEHNDGITAALIAKRKQLREEFLESRRQAKRVDHYYPSEGLPEDSVLVVKTRNLFRFIDEVNGAPPPQNDLNEKERDTLKKQVAAIALVLAEKGGRYSKGTAPNAHQIAGAVVSILDAMPDVRKKGVSSSAIRASIKAGLELLKS